MKAMIAAQYGGPGTMQLQEVPTPIVGDDEVLLAVRATSLQALDWHLLRADPAIVRLSQGLFRPKRTIHGVDIAGVVEAVGINVDELEPGDEVFGWSDHGGGLAEYVALRRDHVRTRPQNLTLEEAATVGVAAFIALQMVRDQALVSEILREAANARPGLVSPFVRAGSAPVEWFRALIDEGVASGELRPLNEPHRFTSLMGAITVFHFAAMPWLTLHQPLDPWRRTELEKHKREILLVSRVMVGMETGLEARTD
jgi:hypothetical protein